MACATHVPVNPEMLRWAREEAGMSLEEAAGRAGIAKLWASANEPVQSSGECLGRMEAGELPLSVDSFRALASLYCRPEITFFLKSPPQKNSLAADFRTGQDRMRDSPEFAALKRRMLCLYKALREMAERKRTPRLSLVGSRHPTDSVARIAEHLHALLGDDPRKDTENIKDEEVFFWKLKERMEEMGVYVLLLGGFGQDREISGEEYTSICLADSEAAILVLNARAVWTAPVFFLIRELCHILLGLSGIFNDSDICDLNFPVLYHSNPILAAIRWHFKA